MSIYELVDKELKMDLIYKLKYRVAELIPKKLILNNILSMRISFNFKDSHRKMN